MRNRGFNILAAFIGSAILLFAAADPLFAGDSPSPFSVWGQTTYGSYAESIDRRRLRSERFFMGYSPDDDRSAVVSVNTWELIRKRELIKLAGTDYGLRLSRYNPLVSGGSAGIAVALNYNTSNDGNSDGTATPYAAVLYRAAGGEGYFDAGYAKSAYADTTVGQVTMTWGTPLFDRWAWSQTRLYVINANSEAGGVRRVASLEERLTWFAVPGRFFLNFSVLAGRRVHAYDPDLMLAYTLPDVHTGSLGMSATYFVTSSVRVYADATREAYRNESESNNYSATYGTVGIAYIF